MHVTAKPSSVVNANVSPSNIIDSNQDAGSSSFNDQLMLLKSTSLKLIPDSASKNGLDYYNRYRQQLADGVESVA
jgi:hypothetical protein